MSFAEAVMIERLRLVVYWWPSLSQRLYRNGEVLAGLSGLSRLQDGMHTSETVRSLYSCGAPVKALFRRMVQRFGATHADVFMDELVGDHTNMEVYVQRGKRSSFRIFSSMGRAMGSKMPLLCHLF
ncbi:unnamed protein product, partial [Pylaiella littoralis]